MDNDFTNAIADLLAKQIILLISVVFVIGASIGALLYFLFS